MSNFVQSTAYARRELKYCESKAVTAIAFMIGPSGDKISKKKAIS